jgi:nucleoside-diphosphate-sugar epimerase
MKILIIGGTGLISTPMTHFLLERGDDVTLYNRGKSEYVVPSSVKVITGDRTDYTTFEAQMQQAGHFDCVIDMVGYAPSDGESVIRAFRGRIGHFLFCSTVDVYQKPNHHYPYTEDAPYGGLNDYARHKVIIEKALRAAHERGDFPVTIIRPAYTYGDGRGVLYPFGTDNTYIERIRAGKPIIVHGDGSSLWVACHSEDVARAFVNAAHNPVTFGKQYHTAGEETMTWDIYHQKVAEALGAPPPKIVHIPTDILTQISPKRAGSIADNFQFNNLFDNRAAHEDLGFRYTISWVEGVRRSIAWLEAHGKTPRGGDDSFDDAVIEAWHGLSETLRSNLALGVSPA